MPSTFTIERADFSSVALHDFVQAHLDDLAPTAPAESRHALDPESLREPRVRLWVATDGGAILGTAALAELAEPGHEEIKSMRTDPARRGEGIAGSLLAFVLDDARSRGVRRVSLETGSMEFFAPARRLYARAGFTPCPPFGSYVEDPNSTFMTLSLGGPAAVVFDLYDTVVFVDPEARRQHQEALASRMGLPADVFVAHWGATSIDSNSGRIGPTADRFREVMRRTGATGADPDELAEAEHAFLTKETRTIPGIPDLLSTLRSRGVRLGLLSNCSPSVRFALDAAGVRDAFDVISLSYETGLVKPDPRFFRLAARELSVEPSAALYVADGMDGELASAVDVGMQAVRAAWANPDGSGPDAVPVATTVEALTRILA